jgi:hypothetical protein
MHIKIIIAIITTVLNLPLTVLARSCTPNRPVDLTSILSLILISYYCLIEFIIEFSWQQIRALSLQGKRLPNAIVVWTSLYNDDRWNEQLLRVGLFAWLLFFVGDKISPTIDIYSICTYKYNVRANIDWGCLSCFLGNFHRELWR